MGGDKRGVIIGDLPLISRFLNNYERSCKIFKLSYTYTNNYSNTHILFKKNTGNKFSLKKKNKESHLSIESTEIKKLNLHYYDEKRKHKKTEHKFLIVDG